MRWFAAGRAEKAARGRAAGEVPVPPAGPVSASPGAWAFLPPLQRVIGDPPATTAPRGFPGRLPAWRDPSFTGRMSHVISPIAPAGVIDADGGGVGVPRVSASAGELPLLPASLPQPVSVQRAAPVSHRAAAAGPALTEADPWALPILHVVAQPAETPPLSDIANPQVLEQRPQAQLLSAPDTQPPNTGPLLRAFDNGGATTVALPGPPVQRRASSAMATGGRAAGPLAAQRSTAGAQHPRLGLGAPLPPAPAVAASDRPAPAVPEPTALEPTALESAAPEPTAPGLAAPGPAVPESTVPEPAAATTLAPGMPESTLTLAVQRSSDNQSHPGTPPAASASAPAPAATSTPADVAHVGLLGERSAGPGTASAPTAPTALVAPVREPLTPAGRTPGPADSPAAAAPDVPATPTHLPVQRTTRVLAPRATRPASRASMPASAPAGAKPMAASVDADPAPRGTDPTPAPPPPAPAPTVQREVGVLAQRALAPLVSTEISPTMPAPAPRPAAHAVRRAHAQPAVPITVLAPDVPDVPTAPSRHGVTLSAIPLQRSAPAIAGVPTAGSVTAHSVVARSTTSAVPASPVGQAEPLRLPLGGYPPAAALQREAEAVHAPPQPAPEPEAQAAPESDDSAPAGEPPRPTDPVATAAEPPLSSPTPAAAPTSAGTGTVESAPSQEHLDELARRLMPPLTRRLRAEMLIDRERRGLRSDPR